MKCKKCDVNLMPREQGPRQMCDNCRIVRIGKIQDFAYRLRVHASRLSEKDEEKVLTLLDIVNR